MSSMSRRDLLRASGLLTLGGVAAGILAACQPRVVEVERIVEKVVKEEVIVEGTPQIIEKVVTAEAPEPPPVAKEVVKLQYTSWGNETRLKADEQNIVAFNERYPEIEVEFIGIARDYTTQILTMFAAGDPPDVLRINAWDTHAFYSRGRCLALDDYFAREGIVPEEIYVEPYVQCIYEGKWYGIPRGGTGVQVFFYNKEMFDDAGVPYPEKQDWTWYDFLEVAKALTKRTADGKVEQFGFDFWCWYDQESYSTAIWGNGGQWFNEDETKCLIGEPEAVEAIQWWADLRCVHNVAPTPGQIPEGMGNPFFSGLTAMVQCGTWAIDTLRPTEFDWGIVSWPAGPKRHVSGSKPNANSISAETRHPEESWELQRYLGGEEVARRDAKNGLWAPNTWALMNSEWYQNSDEKPYDLSPTVVNKYCEVQGIPLNPKAAQIRDAVRHELDLVLNCAEDAASALARAAEAVDAILAEG